MLAMHVLCFPYTIFMSPRKYSTRTFLPLVVCTMSQANLQMLHLYLQVIQAFLCIPWWMAICALKVGSSSGRKVCSLVFDTHSWGWHTQCGLVAYDPCDVSNIANKPLPSMPLRASWYLVIVFCARGVHHGENFHLMYAYDSIVRKFTLTTWMFQLKVMHLIHFPLALSRTMATQYEQVSRLHTNLIYQ